MCGQHHKTPVHPLYADWSQLMIFNIENLSELLITSHIHSFYHYTHEIHEIKSSIPNAIVVEATTKIVRYR